LDAEFFKAYNNMGSVLQDLGELDEAVLSLKTAISLRPDFSLAHTNLGSVYRDMRQLEKSAVSYNKAISLNPSLAEAHNSLGFVYLQLMDFKKGFDHYEWRWKSEKQAKFIGGELCTSKPRWEGQSHGRVLIWPEQGLGDEIMFSSIIEDVYKNSSDLLVQADERLLPLFKRSFPTDVRFFSKEEQILESDYDYQIPMGSLGMYFRSDLKSFATSAKGYLKADRELSKKLRSSLCIEDDEMLIGISWKSHSSVRGSNRKSLPLSQLMIALNAPKRRFINLQYGDVSSEIQQLSSDFGIEVLQVSEIDNKGDIEGLASLICACDKVVSTSNVTVHLAGSLGIETKVLLPFSWDWRWGSDQTDSYWYKSLKLYRQSEIGDWKEPLHKLRTDM
jgi:tetratricopeptide (TPR) repeat protein